MNKLSDKEMIFQNSINLAYCALLEKEGFVNLNELSDLIPGFIHINNISNHGLEFVSKKGLELFERSMQEIKNKGRKFLIEICDLKSLIHYEEKKTFLKNNNHKTYSHFQRLQDKERNIPFHTFYTTSKLYRNKEGIISFTQPLHLLQQDSFLKEIVDGRFIFFNKNYIKFQTLTKRECEILKLIANGSSNKTIFERLHLSFHTVRTHRKNICQKLETGKLIELIKFSQVFQK